MEKQIGTTDLRQKLTDVIQEIKEEKATYVVETFGRPQVAIVDLDQYQNFLRYQQEREAFFSELKEIAAENAERNADLTEADVLALIEQARQEVWEEQQAKKQAD
ncbi:MAG: hypothetical protein WAS33_24905 [Candidatus Promineifilaceae bacterium]|nr:type II toxin-antitoxin system Phd/YefM family antitoxin [Anaerolineaceae bacterium]